MDLNAVTKFNLPNNKKASKVQMLIVMGIIKLLRLYNLLSPFEKGKYFIEKTITDLVKEAKWDLKTIIRCRYKLRFLINIKEPQFCQILCHGIYEEPETLCLTRILRQGDTLLDIGANFGWYTILGAQLVAPTGRVYAFEPIPSNYAILRDNVLLSEHKNIIILNHFALSDNNRDEEFYLFNESAIGNASAMVLGREVKVKHVCQTRMIDDYLKENNIVKVDFIKCDVEGFELKVMRGATNLLSSERPPIILIEINEQMSKGSGYEGTDIIKYIYESSKKRYSFYRISKNRLSEYKFGSSLKDLENILCVVKDIHSERLKPILIK